MVAFDVTPWSALMEGVDLDELVAELVNRPVWHVDALCREYPKVDWFPPRGRTTEPAREVCRRCTVRAECLAWAMGRGVDLQGVWGGTSNVQRKRAHVAGLDLEEILDAVDTRVARDSSPSNWATEPCSGCAGNLSRTDLERGDGWCWACRPSPEGLHPPGLAAMPSPRTANVTSSGSCARDAASRSLPR